MEFSRQEHWSGLPFPSPGDLPNPGIKPRSPAWQADSLPSEPPGKPRFPRCKWGGRCVGSGGLRARPSAGSPGPRQRPGVVSSRDTGTRPALCVLRCIPFSVTSWTAAHQALLSMGSPRQECWRGLPFPPPGDLPDPGIEPVSPALAGGFVTTRPPGKPGQHSKHQVMMTVATVF